MTEKEKDYSEWVQWVKPVNIYYIKSACGSFTISKSFEFGRVKYSGWHGRELLHCGTLDECKDACLERANSPGFVRGRPTKGHPAYREIPFSQAIPDLDTAIQRATQPRAERPVLDVDGGSGEVRPQHDRAERE